MQAVVKAKAEPGLWLETVPVPEVAGDDVLIRVLKTSICGTDVHIYNWDAWAQKTIPVPMTIGHEFVGVVDRAADRIFRIRNFLLAVDQRLWPDRIAGVLSDARPRAPAEFQNHRIDLRRDLAGRKFSLFFDRWPGQFLRLRSGGVALFSADGLWPANVRALAR